MATQIEREALQFGGRLQRGSWLRIFHGVRRRPRLAISAFVVAALFLLAFMAPLLAPRDPLQQNLAAPLQAPSLQHPFGTDQLGRDLLSRALYGARTSLTVAVVATAVGATAGVAVGIFAGYAGRWADNIVMGIIEVFLAFPFILLALLIVAFLGPGQNNVILALILTGWVSLARVTRGQTLSIKNEAFVEAARVVGCSHWRIAYRHVLPQLVSSITVLATVEAARMVLIEGSLSFLGLGVALPEPSWGNMLNEGKNYMRNAWWMVAFPSLLFTVLVISFNQLGDGLRDVLDPALRGR
jgi:peptide/nickel transport system permease protein